MYTEPQYEWKYLSAWRGSTLAVLISEAQQEGFVVSLWVSNIKHACWMKRPVKDA